jgi:hypothetical protein
MEKEREDNSVVTSRTLAAGRISAFLTNGLLYIRMGVLKNSDTYTSNTRILSNFILN